MAKPARDNLITCIFFLLSPPLVLPYHLNGWGLEYIGLNIVCAELLGHMTTHGNKFKHSEYKIMCLENQRLISWPWRDLCQSKPWGLCISIGEEEVKKKRGKYWSIMHIHLCHFYHPGSLRSYTFGCRSKSSLYGPGPQLKQLGVVFS